jgi:hypothetical protein
VKYSMCVSNYGFTRPIQEAVVALAPHKPTNRDGLGRGMVAVSA